MQVQFSTTFPLKRITLTDGVFLKCLKTPLWLGYSFSHSEHLLDGFSKAEPFQCYFHILTKSCVLVLVIDTLIEATDVVGFEITCIPLNISQQRTLSRIWNDIVQCGTTFLYMVCTCASDFIPYFRNLA